jgi:hypothetical protein
MTYMEFIIGVENNIAKANCNKLNIGEYEEKQKQIYKQIRADAIDEYKEEVLSRFCECCDQYACNGAMIGSRQECTTICMLRDVCTDIANELKENK